MKRKRIDVRELAITGVLTALALIIPLVFTGLRVVLPPAFTATLMSHVPSMLAMFISPFAAIGVGLGSALGFTIFASPLIGARALSHVLFAWAGNALWRRGVPMWLVFLLVLPVHAVAEYLAVLAFGMPKAVAMTTLLGTGVHHLVDAAITWALIGGLRASGRVRWFERPTA